MTKSAHDLGCGARKRHPEKCDCRQGLDRRIKKRAERNLERQRRKIAVKAGIPYEDTLQEKAEWCPQGKCYPSYVCICNLKEKL